jgi:hypothetical protein
MESISVRPRRLASLRRRMATTRYSPSPSAAIAIDPAEKRRDGGGAARDGYFV